ncbi:redoxin domain-containing protein [Arthrobacter sp. UYCu723]
MSQRLTAGETAPAFTLADSTGALHSLAEVLSISPDPVEKLAKFAGKEELTFPLRSDEDQAVADAYGA